MLQKLTSADIKVFQTLTSEDSFNNKYGPNSTVTQCIELETV